MEKKEDCIERALEWIGEGRKVALATVIATWGTSPLAVGSQLLVDGKGAFEGSVSGGCIEAAVITEALDVIREGPGKRLFFGVSNEQAWEVGLACGGEIEVYVERVDINNDLYEEVAALRRDRIPLSLITNLTSHEKRVVKANDPASLEKFPPEIAGLIRDSHGKEGGLFIQLDEDAYFIHQFFPEPRLIIIGAVHIAGPLARIARMTGFDVLIIDPRAAFGTKERFPDIELNVEWPDEALEKMVLHTRTAVVLLTHDPKLDDPALKILLNSDVFYIGALGSRKTHASRLERLKNAGFSEESLRRIHGPVGLDINASTPAEIAVAIMAEIIQKRRMAD